MDPERRGELEYDTTPFTAAQYWGMLLMAILGGMLGSAITAFFGLAWPKRPGSRALAIVGVCCMVLHTAGFLLWLAAPSWYPALHQQFPGLPDPRSLR